MIDLTLPWCIYRTTHNASAFYYEGKGQTVPVSNGTYKGSGIRFKLALVHPGFEENTWTTSIIQTYATAAQAYAAEALLVPLESLTDPFRLNMSAGGQVLRQNHSLLYKKLNAAKRREKALIKKQKDAAKKAIEVAELKSLKLQLKNKGKK